MDTTEILTAVAEAERTITNRIERRVAVSALETEWAEHLRQEYAPQLTPAQATFVYRHAWETGHSAGYQSVEAEYLELAEMLDGINGAA